MLYCRRHLLRFATARSSTYCLRSGISAFLPESRVSSFRNTADSLLMPILMYSLLQTKMSVCYTPGNVVVWSRASECIRSSQPALSWWQDNIAASNCLQSSSFAVLKCTSQGQNISLNTFLTISLLWICCSTVDVGFPCPLEWYFGGMGRTATRMHARFKGFDLIVKLMFARLKYTGYFFLLPKWFVRCVCSELPNTETIAAPSGCHSYWRVQNQPSYDEIQLMYLFIPPPVGWFHLWVDTYLSFSQFLCWSIWHMFPQHRLLNVEFNVFNRIVKEDTCVNTVMMVVWISQTIVPHFGWIQTVDLHHVGQFVKPLE